MDEAGRMTQPPHIMAPSGVEADPVVDAASTIVDNGIMSSRTRTGSSRSGAARRADGTNGNSSEANGTAASEAAETNESAPAAESATTAKEAPAAAPAAAPLPAETVGRDQGPARSYPATPSQRTGSAYAPPQSPPSGNASPANGAGSAPGSAFSSVSEFSSGAVSAVSGAAAGFASSVGAVFAKRGQKSNGQWNQRAAAARKPAKRQAMLTLARVEPWSVMKFSFVASVVAFVILFVAVAVLYMVLSALGVFDSLQNTVSSVTSSQGSAGTNIAHWFSASLILGYTAMLGALNIVLITAISTVGSVVYNLIAKTIGGIEVTLRETE